MLRCIKFFCTRRASHAAACSSVAAAARNDIEKIVSYYCEQVGRDAPFSLRDAYFNDDFDCPQQCADRLVAYVEELLWK